MWTCAIRHTPSRRIATTTYAMADSQLDEKVVYALLSAVATNMYGLRQGIDGLRQIHNRWTGNNGISINLIAQLTALKSNLANMHDFRPAPSPSLRLGYFDGLVWITCAAAGCLGRPPSTAKSRLYRLRCPNEVCGWW
jgi:hypothetical protein